MRVRLAFGDVLLSGGGLAVLLLTLVAVDDRVREQISQHLARASASTELIDAGSHVRDLASVVFEAARDQSIEHAPLVIFALVATVLVLFMLRL